jgi:hypothetical protein
MTLVSGGERVPATLPPSGVPRLFAFVYIADIGPAGFPVPGYAQTEAAPWRGMPTSSSASKCDERKRDRQERLGREAGERPANGRAPGGKIMSHIGGVEPPERMIRSSTRCDPVMC